MKPAHRAEGRGCQEARGGQQGCAGRAAAGRGSAVLRASSCSLQASNLRLLSWGGKREAAPQHPAQPGSQEPDAAPRSTSSAGNGSAGEMGNSPPRQLPVLLFSSRPQAAGSEEPARPGSWHSHAPRWRGGDWARRLRAHSLQPSRGGCQNARGIWALRCLRGPETFLHPPQRRALTRPHCTSSLPCRKRGNSASPSARGRVKKINLRPGTGTAARSA